MAVADVVGPVCETGDYLALDRTLGRCRWRATSLAVLSAGAYGAVQAGTYNSRLLVPEVMVDGQRNRGRVRPRGSYDALIALDHVPDGWPERSDTGPMTGRTGRGRPT